MVAIIPANVQAFKADGEKPFAGFFNMWPSRTRITWSGMDLDDQEPGFLLDSKKAVFVTASDKMVCYGWP
jgi:hypothetical protein